MLTLATCTKELNSGEKKYTKEEVEQIREFLYQVARLQVESEKNI